MRSVRSYQISAGASLDCNQGVCGMWMRASHMSIMNLKPFVGLPVMNLIPQQKI
jgi:hypothetical protein